jgi:sugar phosphate isomerase/epimerase
MDETLDLLAAVGKPEVKMVLDTYHLGHDPALIERIDEILPHVALVQLGDGRQPPQGEQCRCRLGDGVVPVREIVAALCQAGYVGYYDVELLGEEFDASDYHGLLRHALDAFRDLVACNSV